MKVIRRHEINICYFNIKKIKGILMKNGEDTILDILGKYFPNSHPHFIMGRGDDCALITIPLSSAFTQDMSASPCSPLVPKIINNSSNNSHILAVTSDIFAENAHFRSRYFTPAQVGHKALAVNISDLAGNGARPSAFSLNLSLTDEQDFAWLEEFFASMAKLSQCFDMGLSGGDLTKTPTPRICVNTDNYSEPISSVGSANSADSVMIDDKEAVSSSVDVLGINKQHFHTPFDFSHVKIHPESISGLNIGITAWGDYGHGGVPLLRHKSYTSRNNAQNTLDAQQVSCFAQENDYIFVVGEIGLARTGLFNLEKTKNKEEVQEVIKQYPAACNAHLNPMPLVKEGLFLSIFATEHPIFLMDVSDGLMRDIPRLLARQGIVEKGNKSFGAKIYISEADLNQEISTFAKSINQNPINFAYSGGEDYGLLGICPPQAWEKLQEKWQENNQFARLWKIGEVCKKGLTLNDIEVKEDGFDHFQK